MASHDRFRIVGGTSLRGEVSVTGAKNSVLKLMAASLLAAGTTTIRNVPDIADVDIMADLLTRLGCTVVRGADTVTITVPHEPAHRASIDESTTIIHHPISPFHYPHSLKFHHCYDDQVQVNWHNV